MAENIFAALSSALDSLASIALAELLHAMQSADNAFWYTQPLEVGTPYAPIGVALRNLPEYHALAMVGHVLYRGLYLVEPSAEGLANIAHPLDLKAGVGVAVFCAVESGCIGATIEAYGAEWYGADSNRNRAAWFLHVANQAGIDAIG